MYSNTVDNHNFSNLRWPKRGGRSRDGWVALTTDETMREPQCSKRPCPHENFLAVHELL